MLQTIIADSIFIPMYVFLQLFVCLKCVGITTHKKRAFWIILIATLVLEIINCWLQAQPGYADSMLLQTLHSIVHALSTFIILAVIGIDGSGYLPRNFILIFFYMDFLTSLPIAPSALLWNMVLYKYLPEDGNNVAGSYHASLEIDVINLVVWAVMILTIIGVSLLFNRKLKSLLSKVPDIICLLFFAITFFAYVIRETVLLTHQQYIAANYITEEAFLPVMFNLCLILLLLLAVIILLLLWFILQKRQLQHIQSLESAMLLDYYQNVSVLHGSIRSLRHDLSNHLAVPEESYRDSLLTICDQIDSQIHSQLFWQSIKTEALSSREKYEIFRYLQLILQSAKLPPEALCITEEYDSIRFTISAAKGLHLARLKNRPLFLLLKRIAVSHGARATWKKAEHGFTLQFTNFTIKENDPCCISTK